MSMVLDFLDLEEEVVEAEGRPIYRTKPLYLSTSPEGLDWGEYFKRLRMQSAPEDEPEPEDEMEVIEPGYELEDPQKAPGAAGTLLKRLAAQGWETRARMAVVRIPAVLYASNSDEGAKTTYNKGDVRFAEHVLEVVGVLGVKRAGGNMLACTAAWERKEGGSWKYRGSTTSDPYLGQVWRPSKRKPRPQRQWEIEDDVPAPIGLDNWIDIVAPKPAPKRKEKHEQAA